MSSPAPTRPSYARWRVLTLIAVHVLFAAHIVHWKLAGKTLAPLELNELMYTLEAGIITAGFLFMALVCLSVLVFGRFFCSWGCHILALQDLCSWGMQKLGLRPKVVRSKGLLLIPFGALFYMFIWPQLQFVLFDRARPALHISGQESGWASFVTSDFWRNLPAPGIALLTFAICGFAFVVLMGHRAFCKYACPYGAIFYLLDRFAPGRISQTGDCSACGLCTAACQSDIQVHEELGAYGQVVNSACLRDLDCLNACPDAAIGFRFQSPPIFLARVAQAPRKKPSMFTPREEWGMLVAFLPCVLILRGLYGIVPFLLTLALAAMLGYLGVIGLRLLRVRSVKLVRYPLKSAGRLRPAGWVVLGLCTIACLFMTHSSVIQAKTRIAVHELDAAGEEPALAGLERGLAAYEFVERWGLLQTPGTRLGIARLHRARGDLLVQQDDIEGALHEFELAVLRLSHDPRLHFNLGRLLTQAGRVPEAIEHYERSLALDPEDPETHNNLGYLQGALGQSEPASAHLRRAIALDPEYAHPHFNLGRMLYEAGERQAALGHFERAAALDPLYAEWLEKFLIAE